LIAAFLPAASETGSRTFRLFDIEHMKPASDWLAGLLASLTLPHPDLRPGQHNWRAAMPWIYLGIAGVLEIVWAFSMKKSEGFTRPVESAITIGAMVISFWLLSLAMKSLPLGTAYAIWTGIGALGAFILGIMLLGEAATPMRILSAAAILAGIIGLRLAA
jgi:quaternary ammonium compound-resistance protein SugE